MLQKGWRERHVPMRSSAHHAPTFGAGRSPGGLYGTRLQVHCVCRWGSAQDNKKIERALVQYKKKTAFRRKVKGWHPGAWMLESDGF